ncbi:MAG TPA: AbiV family abortive infection protein [Candidatus Sulfotelmatobacter sp.]|nr:AbiV family abortive infection protein [Candidatus Sulfotelmatobacter sp.]
MTQDNCYSECIQNAESLLETAEILLEKRKYGIAQSLSITAVEEVAKAIILELVQYGKFDKDYAEKVLCSRHEVKQGLLKAIENGLILIDDINRNTNYKIDKTQMETLTNKLKSQLSSWKRIRLNGLYVDVDVKKQGILSSPRSFNFEDTLNLIVETKDIINFVKGVSELLRESFGNSGTTINNIQQFLFGKWTLSYDEA